MTSRQPDKGAGKDAVRPASQRAERLKAALKRNLGRRKAQAKARSDKTDGQ